MVNLRADTAWLVPVSFWLSVMATSLSHARAPLRSANSLAFWSKAMTRKLVTPD